MNLSNPNYFSQRMEKRDPKLFVNQVVIRHLNPIPDYVLQM